MTNTPNQANQATKVSTVKEEKSLMSKIGGGFSWWIGSLTGHPKSATKVPTFVSSSPAQAEPASSKTTPAPNPASQTSDVTKNEDSVLQDVAALKSLVSKVSGGVVSKVAPSLKVGVSTTSKAANTVVTRMGPSFITKILKIFFILLLLIVLAFVGYKFMSSVPVEEETPAEPGSNEDITPTPVVYNPPSASIYATDEVILKLEEDINVITQEIGSTALREGQLTPPVLDFNVNF